MRIDLIEINGVPIAEIHSDTIVINTPQDALEIIANCGYQGAGKIIIGEHNVSPEFFDLKSRLAGEVLQKFSNYQAELAIVGDFSKYPGRSLQDFIFESNKTGRVSFVDTVTRARDLLGKESR